MKTVSKLFPENDPEFRRQVLETVRELVDRKTSGRSPRVQLDPEHHRLKVPVISPEGMPLEEGIEFLIDEVFRNRIPADHKRHFSFVPGPASPLSWLGGLISDAFNNHAGSWLHAQGASSVEESLIRYLGGRIGYPGTRGGTMVSGGSMGNLTAVVLARDTKLKEEERHLGVAYISDQTHSSVAKGMRIAGLMAKQIRTVRTNDDFQMDVRALNEAMEMDLAAGRKPFLVIGSAGTTNTGSIDPLDAMADVCQRHGAWFHVDGAYGASVALSNDHGYLLKGIERTNSLTWDAHKWLFQTYGCAMFLVRDQRQLYDCFHTNPEYLHDLASAPEQPNYMDLGIELTRPARAVRLWFTLGVAGSEEVGNAIDHNIRLAEYAEEWLKKEHEARIVSHASIGILNFRFEYPGLSRAACDQLNHRVCERSQEKGYSYIVTTTLHGETVIRICTIHPGTTELDMEKSLSILRDIARDEWHSMTEELVA
jgi:glutamate/tyrosine decarboxylase-like PLP-dependent enzyme